MYQEKNDYLHHAANDDLRKNLLALLFMIIMTNIWYMFTAWTPIQKNVVNIKYCNKAATTLQPILFDVFSTPTKKTINSASNDTHNDINIFGGNFSRSFLI